jgi:hypothetical protein
MGLLGAIMGFFIGTGLAMKSGPEIFKVTARAIKPEYKILLWVMIAAPLFTSIASFIPTITAVVRDPALSLREE